MKKPKQTELNIKFPDGSKISGRVITLCKGGDIDLDKFTKNHETQFVVLFCKEIKLTEVAK